MDICDGLLVVGSDIVGDNDRRITDINDANPVNWDTSCDCYAMTRKIERV